MYKPGDIVLIPEKDSVGMVEYETSSGYKIRLIGADGFFKDESWLTAHPNLMRPTGISMDRLKEASYRAFPHDIARFMVSEFLPDSVLMTLSRFMSRSLKCIVQIETPRIGGMSTLDRRPVSSANDFNFSDEYQMERQRYERERYRAIVEDYGKSGIPWRPFTRPELSTNADPPKKEKKPKKTEQFNVTIDEEVKNLTF